MTRAPLPVLAARGEVHFMGAGGAGMCGLAELLARRGVRVTGCDLRPGRSAAVLEAIGVPIAQKHDPLHVSEAAALVVSAAVPGDDPEIEAARARGIPVLKRASALGEWVAQGRVVAVAGTHGKTSTTAMLTEMLAAADMDPTCLVGGRVPSWGGNLRLGGDELFVVEADEYDRSFHHLTPEVAVITNVEADHLDMFGSLEGVNEAFQLFVASVPPEGCVIACADDHGASRLSAAAAARLRSYGLGAGSQLRGEDVEAGPMGSRFGVVEDGRAHGRLALRAPGVHNVRNALGAAAAARWLGASWGAIKEGLARFTGVGRRFERLGEPRGVAVVDDYAHHPTEIQATLAAARTAFPGRRIVAVFQPHLFSRTRDFAPGFGRVLARADVVWITDVYPAREHPIPGVSGALVADATSQAGARDVRYHPDLEDLPEALASELRPGDVCLTLGAGSVEKVGPALLKTLAAEAA